jgi:hypothetical protein
MVTVRKLHVKLNIFLRFVGFDLRSEAEKEYRLENITVTTILMYNIRCQFHILFFFFQMRHPIVFSMIDINI